MTDPERYRLTFFETPNPTVITDENLQIVDVNRACVEFTGYSREELLGSPPSFLVNDSETYREITRALADRRAWEGEVEAVTKSGDRAFGYGATFPIVADGELRGYGGIFVDLSDRRRYTRTIQVLNRLLRHNIRNDVNVVAGVLETIRPALERPERDLLDRAMRRVDRLLDRAETARELNALLAKEDAEDAALSPVRLDEVARMTVRSLPPTDADVTLELPDDPVYVLADGAVQRAVAALVENGIEHADTPRPWVGVSIERTADRVFLTVEDDGPGIDADRADLLFGRREETPLQHGQGLSLFFVDRLMDLYGGAVEYRPRDPTGSVFELEFRRVADGADA
ncbi:PAS domain S-box-containing protein [Halopelagius inordinatus]|uniref:histidine kinase n=1 Tax=Halopelagius inordinatus TaxID=553467 RepID=A0A1I2TAE5_9EURY|nr:PAS domain S-box protein [Halopelagius inordinatus]SFG60217.1 PAS domain S-box-containing protein [Halopelagius inordinatus]